MNDGVPSGSPPLVVGLGSPDRGDDAVGPHIVRRVAELQIDGVDVATHEDPTALVELWRNRGLVIVVDAVLTGAAAGEVTVLEAGRDRDPIPESAWSDTGRGGTHAFGLAAAIELARALNSLPERVVVVGVEAECFDHGAPLSAAVSAAVDDVVDTVREIAAKIPLRSDA